ncbi:hypothetical protein ciss_01580 [Carboxydothermus islandicus]|uniref:Phage Gp37/Gp68 family protein n=1 Tax=Carboxydothermus islandicus TaxID=661089 RepID=A0A1L8CZ63_9THEO|nr:phage Gp37/Gp68 family protein [Carboxydothermus islandicus]GAV24225.1 hypothetical protein ciss_01580 [Carboxydothermus islandicus]
MALNSSIEWTEASWNPVTGCTKISAGCQNCYAERLACRLKIIGIPRYRNGFKVTVHEDVLDYPLKWKKPRMIFVNSMSDLFHEEVPEEFIIRVFNVMNLATHHTFQVLTKRPERALKIAGRLKWTENIWFGVTVENFQAKDRIKILQEIPAKIRFLSCEPLLEPLYELNLSGIHWVIVGGESGPGARPIEADWVRDILRQCQKQNVPFFFKQWGGKHKRKNGRLLDGKIWSQYPELSMVSV